MDFSLTQQIFLIWCFLTGIKFEMNDNKIQAGYACFSSIHHMITIKDTMGLHLVIFYKKNKQKDKYHRICIVESKVILSEYLHLFFQ